MTRDQQELSVLLHPAAKNKIGLQVGSLAASGFTIMEMIVAFTIMGLMLFLIDRIFFDTTRGMEQGTALSNVTLQSNIVSDQITNDAALMLAPNGAGDGGVLVIFNKDINAPRLPADGTVASTIRSDQLLFIGDNSAGKLQPICPINSSSFAPPSGGAVVRIWYGHLRRTNNDGTAASDLGVADSANYYAKDWILGRQALFFNATSPGVNVGSDICTNGGGSTNGTYDASVVNSGAPAAIGAPPQLYQGLADVANADWGPDTTAGTVLNYIQDPDPAVYAARVYEHSFGSERLWCNPQPQYQSGGSYAYNSWQIAQMHPAFVEHVSDLEIAFAGDYDGTAGIDTDASGNISWYDKDIPPPGVFNGGGTTPIYETTALTNAAAEFIFRHNDNGGTSGWPYLIRIRYRLHDPRGKLTSYDPGNLQATPGMWFEVILKVNRS